MVHTYKVKDVLWREIPEERHRLWDVLDKEDSIHILNKDPNLKYCREHYPDGLGTRQFDKLCKINFGYDDRFDVIGYSTDKKGRFLSYKQTGFALATIVKNYGIKPSMFFTKPFEKAFTNLPKELQEQFAKDLENLI